MLAAWDPVPGQALKGLKIELQEHKKEFDKNKNTSNDENVDESAEGFFKGCIVLIGTIFGGVSLNMWINNKLSVLKCVGLLGCSPGCGYG